jgi:photosystem II stability/assembly factor-like uncharacterized protein
VRSGLLVRRLRSGLLPGLVAACAAVSFAACAASEELGTSDDRPDAQTLPATDAAPLSDASTDCADATACGEPVDCTKVDFCAVPFPVSRLVALNAIWGSGPNDVWAVGTRGTILHGDGSTFVPVMSGETGSGDVHVAVWGTSSTDVWILGPSYPLHSAGYDGGAADFEPRQGSSWDPSRATSGRIWAGHSAGDQVWLAGEANGRFGPSSSFWILGADAVSGPVWRPAGACTEDAPCRPAVRALWAADASTAWAVGYDGQAFVFDASASSDAGAPRWGAQNSNTRDDLEGVWGSGPNDVWAVGRSGTMRHTAKGAATWTVVPSATARDLHAVWGSGPNDVWAVGDDGTILHYDGKAWAPAALGLADGDRPTSLLGIWGSGPDDVWIVGEGLLLHRTAASRRHP